MAESRQNDNTSAGGEGARDRAQQRPGQQQQQQDPQRASRAAGEAAGEAAGRAAQAGATGLRQAADSGADATRRAGDASTEALRRTTQDLAEAGRRTAFGVSAEMEETADRYAEAVRRTAQDLGRLMMVPRSAGGALQEMQEALGGLVNGVLRTNLRLTEEVFRRTNPGAVAELQQAFLREYLDALMEGGTMVLRATRRTAEEALRPLEERMERRAARGDGQQQGRQQQGDGARVGEVMTREVRVVNPDETVQQAARLMTDEDTGALPVGENDRLVGMVTDRDLALRVLAEGKDPARTKVREVMTPETHYVFEDQDLDSVAESMRGRQVRRMPVLNREKRLVGVVSLGDLARRAGDRPSVARALSGVSREGGRHDQAAELRRA